MHYALGFLATSLYWPGIAGAASTPRWAILFATVPWMLCPPRLVVSAAHVAGMAFIGWAILTLAWGLSPLDGINDVAVLLLLAACFCLGHQSDNLRPLIIGAALGLTVSSAVAVAQWNGVQLVRDNAVGIPGGLFVNGNFMAEAAALVLVGVVAERLWWLIPGLMPALLLPHARGAVLAVVIAMMAMFRSKIEVVVALGGALVLGAAYTAMHLDGQIADRLEMWDVTIRNLNTFGHGIGSFWVGYADLDPQNVITTSPTHPHNELLHIAFELGVVGVILALAFCATLIGPIDTPRLILIALAVEACFAFPTHTPATAFIGLVAAGHAVRNRYLLCNVAVRGRGTVAPRMVRPGLWPRARSYNDGGARHAVSASLSHRAVRTGAQP